MSSRAFYESFCGREAVLEGIYPEATRGIQRSVTALRIESGETVYEIIRRGVHSGVAPLLVDERLGLVLEREAVGVSPE